MTKIDVIFKVEFNFTLKSYLKSHPLRMTNHLRRLVNEDLDLTFTIKVDTKQLKEYIVPSMAMHLEEKDDATPDTPKVVTLPIYTCVDEGLNNHIEEMLTNALPWGVRTKMMNYLWISSESSKFPLEQFTCFMTAKLAGETEVKHRIGILNDETYQTFKKCVCALPDSFMMVDGIIYCILTNLHYKQFTKTIMEFDSSGYKMHGDVDWTYKSINYPPNLSWPILFEEIKAGTCNLPLNFIVNPKDFKVCNMAGDVIYKR